MVATLSRVDDWLNDALTGDVTLMAWSTNGVYSDSQPQGQTGPTVIFTNVGSSDRPVAFGYALYDVYAVTAGASYSLVESPADRIDALLTVPLGGTVVRGVRITHVKRQESIRRKDADLGIRSVYLGGRYRIEYQPA